MILSCLAGCVASSESLLTPFSLLRTSCLLLLQIPFCKTHLLLQPTLTTPILTAPSCLKGAQGPGTGLHRLDALTDPLDKLDWIKKYHAARLEWEALTVDGEQAMWEEESWEPVWKESWGTRGAAKGIA
jgi:hypothetical protein